MSEDLTANKPLLKSLLSTTIACPNPKELSALLTNDLGWEPIAQGEITNEMELMWGIETGTAGRDYVLYRSPGMNRGMIRVVHGLSRVRRRQRSYRWAGVEIVVMHDLDGIFEKLKKNSHFSAFGPPKDYDFTDVASNIHSAFSGSLPGGTHVTMTMKRTEPTGRKFPTAKAQVGHIFEVPLNTPNYAVTQAFYRKTLGMKSVLEQISSNGPMHEAWNIPAGERYCLTILKGDAPSAGLGAIEIHGCDRKFIDPDSSIPQIFDGGACMVTYSTNNIADVYTAVSKSTTACSFTEPLKISQPPYSGAQTFAFAGPNGERVEVVEQ